MYGHHVEEIGHQPSVYGCQSCSWSAEQGEVSLSLFALENLVSRDKCPAVSSRASLFISTTRLSRSLLTGPSPSFSLPQRCPSIPSTVIGPVPISSPDGVDQSLCTLLSHTHYRYWYIINGRVLFILETGNYTERRTISHDNRSLTCFVCSTRKWSYAHRAKSRHQKREHVMSVVYSLSELPTGAERVSFAD